MIKFKKISAIAIATIITSTMSFSNVFAASNNDSTKKYGEVIVTNAIQTPVTASSSYIEPTNRVFETENTVQSNQIIKPQYGESEVATIVATEYHIATVTPGGQRAGGASFPLGGGFLLITLEDLQ